MVKDFSMEIQEILKFYENQAVKRPRSAEPLAAGFKLPGRHSGKTNLKTQQRQPSPTNIS